MFVWRISDYADLSGQGGKLIPGRWNFKGDRIVYCSDHPSTAMLEILVNANLFRLPKDFQLLKISLPEQCIADVENMPPKWKENILLTQRLWREFCNTRKKPVLRVPSVTLPYTCNYLINPAQIATSEIKISNVTRHEFDNRFGV